MRGTRVRIKASSSEEAILSNNPYVNLFYTDYADFVYDSDQALQFKSRWRSDSFRCAPSAAIDVEIGTGTGLYFKHHALSYPDRCLIGFELKFKPLIQSIRRTVKAGAQNAKIIRGNAYVIDQFFEREEINNVYIHFPDPWPKRRQQKNRILNSAFLTRLACLQRKGALLEFKTDSKDYFDSVRSQIPDLYRIRQMSEDLYASSMTSAPRTQFEDIFVRKGLPIYYLELLREPLS